MALGAQRTTGRSDAGRRLRLDWPLRPAAWAARIAAGILLGLAARALAPHQPSEASHHSDPLQYLKTMRTYEFEYVCTEVFTPYGPPAIDSAVAIARVNDTLYGHPESWHRLGSNRVFFLGTNLDCRHDVRFHEIRYEVREVTDCDIPTASCARGIGSGPTEYDNFSVQIYTPQLVDPDLYQFVVNHETGHVFGLAHNPSGLPYCPGDSIMHYIDPCLNPPTDVSTYPWPSGDDRASVEALIPPPVTGTSPDRAFPR